MSQHNQPILRVTSRPLGDTPEAADAPFAVERLAALSHELSNLLDGSMRCLSLARKSIRASRLQLEDAAGVNHQLETVYGALERMADLVHAAMKGAVVGTAGIAATAPVSLETAVSHAADVVMPEASELGIRISVSISPEAAEMPAGPLYSVVLNGLRNAVESIAAAQGAGKGNQLATRTGHVEVSATLKPIGPAEDASVDLILLEIRDDGRGLPGEGDPNRLFDYGYTTKPGGTGLGLALARDVVREFGGMIELSRRTDRGTAARPGAVLKVAYPVARKRKG